MEALNEVSGGGVTLKSFWKDSLPENATLEHVRKVGEETCMSCYNAAIRKLSTKIDEALDFMPLC